MPCINAPHHKALSFGDAPQVSLSTVGVGNWVILVGYFVASFKFIDGEMSCSELLRVMMGSCCSALPEAIKGTQGCR